MIIELFGPPGSGKTTFAYALSHRLRERGYASSVVLSYRPGDANSALDPGGIITAARRITRAVFVTFSMTFLLFGDPSEFSLAISLVRMLPPKSLIWRIRLGQYIARLSKCWSNHCNSEEIVIFDQAFVQAVCSLALFNQAADERSLERALAVTPKADVVIRLDAPREVLEARLHHRLRHEAMIERLFEAKLRTNLEAGPIVERVHDLLRKAGGTIACFSALDQPALREAIGTVEEEILAKLRSNGSAPHQQGAPLSVIT